MAESIDPGLGMAPRRCHGVMWSLPLPEYDLKIMRAVAAVYRCGRRAGRLDEAAREVQ